MNRTGKIIITAIVVIIVAAGVAFAIANNNEQDDDLGQTPATNQQNSQENTDIAEVDEEIAATITYTNNGFVTDAMSVPAGAVVQVINESDDDLDFSSDPHPVHTDNTEFNVGIIGPGENQTFMITQTGIWGFHNHLHESHTGSITVE